MPSLEANTTQVGAHTDNRHIISMKSRGFLQTPQDIMEKYNGCSVPQYRRYPCNSLTPLPLTTTSASLSLQLRRRPSGRNRAQR